MKPVIAFSGFEQRIFYVIIFPFEKKPNMFIVVFKFESHIKILHHSQIYVY